MHRVLVKCRAYCQVVVEQQHASIMKYLNVAEKNDAAKTIAGHLSNGTSVRVSISL